MKARRVKTAEQWDAWVGGRLPTRVHRPPLAWYRWWLLRDTPRMWEITAIIESCALGLDAIGNPYGRIP